MTSVADRETILFVDDDADTLDVCHRLFRDRYNVLVSMRGAEALEAIDGVNVAVAVVDQRMPEMSGLDVLQRLQVSHPDTSRIVMTAYTDIDDVVKLTNLGRISSFVVKPWHNNQLRVVVDREVEVYRKNRQIAELQAKIEREHRTMFDLLKELEPDFEVPHTNDELKDLKEALRRKVQGAAERLFVQNLLENHPNNISSAARAAKINRTFLYRLMRRHNISTPS
ncbi:MAG: response regulator [Myxococcota bacterium]